MIKTGITGMSGSGTSFLIDNFYSILPYSIIIVAIVFYFDKKNKEKNDV